MAYDAVIIAAHPDDAETQMGGTLAKLTDADQLARSPLRRDLPHYGTTTRYGPKRLRAGAARLTVVLEMLTPYMRDRIQDAHMIRTAS